MRETWFENADGAANDTGLAVAKRQDEGRNEAC